MKTSKTFKMLFWQVIAKKKGAEAPIYARVTVSGRRAEISMDRWFSTCLWDAKMSRAVGRSIEARELNHFLEKVRIQIAAAHESLLKERRYVTAQAVKARYLGTDNRDATLLDIVRYHEDAMNGTLEPGTLKNYGTTEKYLRAYLSKKFRTTDIYLEQLNYRFVVDFEQFLKKEKNRLSRQALTNNGIMKHIERLKKLMNLAVKLEWIEKNPFMNFSLRFEKFDRPYLTAVELEAFETIALERLAHQKARDLFVFGCYTGLSYIDVKKLTRSNLVYGLDGKQWLSLYRQKTDQPLKLPLLAKAAAILDKYADQEVSEKLLPMYSNQKVNAYTKEIALLLGIDKNLSYHVARHTFATTVTLSNGVPIETVSKLLGHKKLSTTQIYARVVEDKLSNDMAALENKLMGIERNAS